MQILNHITLKSYRIINPLISIAVGIQSLFYNWYNSIQYPNIIDFIKDYLSMAVICLLSSIVVYVVTLWLLFIVGRLKVIIFGGTYFGIISSHKILFVTNSLLFIILMI